MRLPDIDINSPGWGIDFARHWYIYALAVMAITLLAIAMRLLDIDI